MFFTLLSWLRPVLFLLRDAPPFDNSYVSNNKIRHANPTWLKMKPFDFDIQSIFTAYAYNYWLVYVFALQLEAFSYAWRSEPIYEVFMCVWVDMFTCESECMWMNVCACVGGRSEHKRFVCWTGGGERGFWCVGFGRCMEAAVHKSVSLHRCACLSKDRCGLVVAVTTKIYQSLKKLISVLNYSVGVCFKFNVCRTINSAVDHAWLPLSHFPLEFFSPVSPSCVVSRF